MEFLTNPYVLYVLAITGMVAHFLKKKIKGESFTEIKNYFSDHFKTTVLSFIATTIGYFAYDSLLRTGQPVDILTCVMIGFTCDSLFNKWEATRPVEL